MEITATFIGTNGSMGFLSGQNYRLQFSFGGNEVRIHHIPTATFCPYQSINAFFANWSNVSGV